MAKKLGEVKYIQVQKILPDADQPRKHFDAIKLKSLAANIKKHGIKRPLDVEDLGNGNYLLEDGERRLRAAIINGMTEVPCMVVEEKSPIDRLIAQFSIQEQQESWTPLEKAVSLLNLSKAMSITLKDTCDMLDIPHQDAQRYISFAQLSDKENFIRNEIPLAYAMQYKMIKTNVKHIMVNDLKREFTVSTAKDLEHQLTKGIIKGTINSKGDLSRLRDAFVKSPKLIDKFLSKDNITPDSLFIEAKANGAYALRNAVNQARQFVVHANDFMEEQDIKLSDEQIKVFKAARKSANDLIALAE